LWRKSGDRESKRCRGLCVRFGLAIEGPLLAERDAVVKERGCAMQTFERAHLTR
jgi:hypothetical protein